MWYGVSDQKVKETRRLISLGLHKGPILSLTQGLHHSPRYQAPSWVGLTRPGRKVARRVSMLQKVSQKMIERERERQRETKKDPGT